MPETVAAKAGLTHRTLTGLVCGASMAASLGAASVALGQIRRPRIGATRHDVHRRHRTHTAAAGAHPRRCDSSHRPRHIRDDHCRRGFRRRCRIGSRTSALDRRSCRGRRRCRIGLPGRTDDESHRCARRRGGRVSRAGGSRSVGLLGRRHLRTRSRIEPDMTTVAAKMARLAGAAALERPAGVHRAGRIGRDAAGGGRIDVAEAGITGATAAHRTTRGVCRRRRPRSPRAPPRIG